MAKSSIHIGNGARGFFAHNSRESWSQSQVFYDEKNEISRTQKEAFEFYKSELAARSEIYTKRTKQKLQKNIITHISSIVNLEKHHTQKDLDPLIKFIEEKLDTKIIQSVIHRDEGKLVNKKTGNILTSGEQFFLNPKDKQLYFDKKFKKLINMNDWNIEKNYHGHFEFIGIDSEGKSIRRKMSTTFFRELQDKTAELLGMERGERSVPNYSKEQMKEIKKFLKPKKEFENDKAYGTAFKEVAKSLGYWKPSRRNKRLDTHEFKDQSAIKNKANAKKNELKELVKELRAELQANKADKEAYRELEAKHKELKEQMKLKDFTIEELKEALTIAQKEQNKPEFDVTQVIDSQEEINHLKHIVRELTRGEIDNLPFYLQEEVKYALLELEANDKFKEAREREAKLQEELNPKPQKGTMNEVFALVEDYGSDEVMNMDFLTRGHNK